MTKQEAPAPVPKMAPRKGPSRGMYIDFRPKRKPVRSGAVSGMRPGAVSGMRPKVVSGSAKPVNSRAISDSAKPVSSKATPGSAKPVIAREKAVLIGKTVADVIAPKGKSAPVSKVMEEPTREAVEPIIVRAASMPEMRSAPRRNVLRADLGDPFGETAAEEDSGVQLEDVEIDEISTSGIDEIEIEDSDSLFSAFGDAADSDIDLIENALDEELLKNDDYITALSEEVPAEKPEPAKRSVQKSPFIPSVTVDKRPLSSGRVVPLVTEENAGRTSASAHEEPPRRAARNVYTRRRSSSSPSSSEVKTYDSRRHTDKPAVKVSPMKKGKSSGSFSLVIAVILMIILGGIVGAFLYLLFFQ